jgi:hypothetical protein
MKIGDLVRFSDGVTIGMITNILRGSFAVLWSGSITWLVPAQIKEVINENR